ncbi:MAG: T9SS type A sorting domain-containing protein, partial [Saprospiraceae bacterium]|nr:T9SS type A sorting domain-containing protein [Saprospiraceae bacterium]
PAMMMAYPISVKGIVYYGHNQGVPGALVVVKSGSNEKFQVDTTLISDDQGFFSFLAKVPDDVARGTLIFTVGDCNHANAQRIVYHADHLNFTLKLKDCHSNNDRCNVRIRSEKIDNQTLKLSAYAKGSAPFSYEWSTGETTSSITVVKPGQYYVVVSAADSCQAKDVFYFHPDRNCVTEIHGLPAVTASSITKLVARSKGAEPFTYLWSTGETNSEISVLEPGEYCVTVVDANGCESRDCKTIKEPSCETEIHAVKISPNLDASHVHLVARSQGQPPFQYFWNTGDTTKMIRVSTKGEFCVRVVDALGCESKDCILLDPSTDCKTEIAVLPDLSANTIGIHLSARTHGRPPFSYKWSTGDTTINIQVDKLLEYCVEVLDSNGCLSTDCIDLAPIGESCSVTIHRSDHGTLIAKPRGFPAFKILWSTGDTTRFIRADSAGDYCVTVINTFGCEAQACISVGPDSNPCRVEIQRKPTSTEATIELVAQIHSDANFKFRWSSGDTTRSIIVSEDGEYCVEVYNGVCRAKDCIKVKIGQSISFKESATNEEHIYQLVSKKQSLNLQAFPNPVVQEVRLQWQNNHDLSDLMVLVSDIFGKPLIMRRLSRHANTNDIALDLSNLEAGIYIMQLIGEHTNEQIKIIKNQ